MNHYSFIDVDQCGDPSAHRLILGFVNHILKRKDPLATRVIKELVSEMARVSDEFDVQAYVELEKMIPHGEFLA